MMIVSIPQHPWQRCFLVVSLILQSSSFCILMCKTLFFTAETCPSYTSQVVCLGDPTCYWSGTCRTIITTTTHKTTTSSTRTTTTLAPLTLEHITTPLIVLPSTAPHCSALQYLNNAGCQNVTICGLGHPETAFATSTSDTVCRNDIVWSSQQLLAYLLIFIQFYSIKYFRHYLYTDLDGRK